MKAKHLSLVPIKTIPQLEELLLSRIPEMNRGDFLKPLPPGELKESHHGLAEQKLTQAVELIHTTHKADKEILIFGDYDCDGVTATAILLETLRHLQIPAKSFLPDRERHGYGMSVPALEEIWQKEQPGLIITVDNGIVANKAFAWLKEKGVKTILTDHHQPQKELPDADVILHTTALSGAGISWYLANALDSKFAQQELDLAVLGTLADQVELVGANRSLAVHGLNALRQTERPSLKALARLAKIHLAKINGDSVQFGLTPRINAMGRLGNADQALQTLLSSDKNILDKLSEDMEAMNKRRQELMKVAIANLEHHIVTKPEDNIVIALGGYAEGILGLLAGKLVDQFHKPAIVISRKQFKASVRSLPGIDITAELRKLPDETFTALGGHAMAAGFTLAEGKFEEFTKLFSTAAQKFSKAANETTVESIGELEWKLLSLETLMLFDKFQPFGSANREPIFSLGEVRVVDAQPVGKTRDHLRIRLQSASAQDSKTIQAICFRYKDKIETENPHDLKQAYIRIHPSSFRPGTVDIELVAGA